MQSIEGKPSRLFHGTPYTIHKSDRPFLDPHLARGKDEGDPTGPYVMATPDERIARMFTLKTSRVTTILYNIPKPAIVFRGSPPERQAGGWVYEIPILPGFYETVRRDKPTGKWAIVAEDIPKVRTRDGREVPGISLTDVPAKRVELSELIKRDNLSIYVLGDNVDLNEYKKTTREVTYHDTTEDFLRKAVKRGWLTDVTDQLLEEELLKV